MALSLMGWKILSMCLFPCIVITGFSLSLLMGTNTKNKLWFTCGVMFSAGVLLSASLVHALNDATETFMELSENDSLDFPWPYAIYGATFLILVSIEEMVGQFVGRFKKSPQKEAESSPDDVHKSSTRKNAESNDDKSMELSVVGSSIGGHDATADDTKSPDEIEACPTITGDTVSDSDHQECCCGDNDDGDHDDNGQTAKAVDVLQTVSPWVAILLLLVLSIHVFLEGFALGSLTDVEQIKSMFIAIAAHKMFTAFALGSSFISSGYWPRKDHVDCERRRRRFILLGAVFIAVDPVSIGLGVALSESLLREDSYAQAILVAAVAGSFLFVAAVELIPAEMEKTKRLYNTFPALMGVLGSLLLGFAAMTLLAKWV